MAQAAPARERHLLPGWSASRPSRKATLISLGLTLALGAWVFQTWTTTLWLQRSQEQERMALVRMERDMWLIEYNASQLRFPRNERVTGRAALHVFENTRELLAASEVAQAGSSSKRNEIVAQRDNDLAQARKLFDEGSYSTLVAGLARANEQFESDGVSEVLRATTASAGLPIWHHALPWVFLVGMLLCAAGAFTQQRRSIVDE